MKGLDFSHEWAFQRYWDLVHRYRQGQISCFEFGIRVRSHWADEREPCWQSVWKASRVQRCREYERRRRGEPVAAEANEPRRMARWIDRVLALRDETKTEEEFRAGLTELLAAYRDPSLTSGEGKWIAFPPPVAVVTHRLPANHRYPCTAADIHAQLADVPEWDLTELRTVELIPRTCYDQRYHGCYCGRHYFDWHYPNRKLTILLFSIKNTADSKTFRSDVGFLKRRFKVKLEYGMTLERVGSQTFCRWTDESYRRFMTEHVLLHEIGHHVQEQQRTLSGFRHELSRRCEEQFAEDYAIRFHRERKQRE